MNDSFTDKMNVDYLIDSILGTEITRVNTVWSCPSGISWAIREERPVRDKSKLVVISSIFI